MRLAPTSPAPRRPRRDRASIAANLQRLRRNSGLELDGLATATGIDPARLAAIEAGRIVGARSGGFRSRTLSAAGDPREPDAYEVTIAPGWTEDAGAHAPDTFERIVVVDGTLTLCAGAAQATLARGDVVFFRADCRHRYVHPGSTEPILHLTMIYAGDGPGPVIF